MRRYGFGFVLVGLLAAAAAGQEAVALKVARPKDGDRLKVTTTEKIKTKIDFAVGGETGAKEDVDTRDIVYVDEVVTADPKGGKPTKLRRTYEKYEVSKGGKDEPGPPLNTVILIEKRDDKYEYTADGKPLDAAFAAKLAAQFDKKGGPRNEDLLPDKPVKPGDTWTVSGEKMAEAFAGRGEMIVDPKGSGLTGKLVKTYRKDGRLFGVMEYGGDIAIKGLGEKAAFELKPGSKMGVKMTVDACVDGTEPSNKVTGDLTFKIEGEGKGVTLTISAAGKTTTTEELLPKK